MTIQTPAVFAAEKEAGLEHKIRSQSSIAFHAPVAAYDGTIADDPTFQPKVENLLELAEAAVDDPDIHHVFSILVSTVWNKNDDIFNKDEVWAARATPRFKPTNLGHDEKQIVGGIINSWAVDANFNLIDDDSTDLPDLYHILVGSVIYKQWQDPQLQARATELIQQIEAGEKFVSMECVFRGFDYGVVDMDGNNHIIARSEDTAFLSQHLRSYGGKGTYQDHRIGRVLKNITFSGKGFVDRPANPDSIIFEKDHIFSFADASEDKSLFLEENGVNTSTEDNSFESNSKKEQCTMSDLLNDQVQELKEALASQLAENKELATKLEAVNVSQYEDKIESLEATVAKMTDAGSDLEGKLSEAEAQITVLEAEMGEKSSTLEALQANFDKMEEDKKKKKRELALVQAGIPTDEVATKIEAFEALNDAQFDAVVETIASMQPTSTETEEADADAVEEAVADEDETEASEVGEEADEAGTSMASENDDAEDEISVARAGLESWMEKVVFNKKSE